MLLVMGTRFSFGVFYSSMLAEMGWSRAATAGIFSVSMLVYAAVASGVGAAFDWWGPRRVFPLQPHDHVVAVLPLLWSHCRYRVHGPGLHPPCGADGAVV